MGATCPIKDENYFKILKALNYDEDKVMQIHIAYEKAGKSFPSYEELVEKGIISQTRKVYSVIDKMYTYVSDRLTKAIQITNDNLKEAIKNKDNKLESEYRSNLANLRNKLYEFNVNRKKFWTTVGKVENSVDEKTGEKIKIKSKELLTKAINIHEIAHETLNYVEELLKSETLDPNEINIINRILNTWIQSTVLSKNNIMFSEDELKDFSLEEIAILNDIGNKAQSLKLKLNNIIKQTIKSELKERFGDNVPLKALDSIEDTGIIRSKLLSVAEFNNPILTYVWFLGKDTEYRSKVQIDKYFKKIDKITEAFSKYSSDDLKNLLLQKDKNGNPILRFIHRYTDEWFKFFGKTSNNIINNIISQNYGKVSRNVRSLLENSYLVNPLLLFDENGNELNNEKAEYIKEKLKKELTPKSYEELMKKIRKKRLNYSEALKNQIEYLKIIHDGDEKEINKHTKLWEEANHPGRVIQKLYNSKTESDAILRLNKVVNFNFFEAVPKKINDRGIKTDFYDENFYRIEDNDILYESYKEIMDLIYEFYSYLPNNVKKEINVNSIPHISLSLIENLFSKGLIKTIPTVWNRFIDSITVENQNNIVSPKNVNPDGTLSMDVKLKDLSFYEPVIDKYVNEKIKQFFITNGKYPEGKEYSDLVEQSTIEIQNKIVKELNFNLNTLLKAYASAVVTYKNKVIVEDNVQLMSNYLHESKELVTTSDGIPIVDSFNNQVINEKGAVNIIKAFDYYVRIFFGHNAHDIEWVTKKKIYSEEEKKVVSEIENRINELDEKFKKEEIEFNDYLNQRIKLSQIIRGYGKNVSASNIIDVINSYIVIKGLGWNPIAPIFNINIGFFSNVIEASRGKYFSTSSLFKAYNLMVSNHKKYMNVFNKIASISNITNEIFAKQKIINNKLEPLYLTELAEKFNQSPLIIAYLLHTKVKYNGKEYSLFDLFDEEGNFTIEDIQNVKFAKDNTSFSLSVVKARVDNIIANVHGNYDRYSPIEANSSVIFRSLLVFRKWLINSFWSRIRPEEYNIIHGEVEKGRWRSYGALFSKYGMLGGSLLLTTATIKKILFMNTSFSNLNEIDQQNMRANITELVFLAYLTAIALLLYGMIHHSEDDEEEELGRGKYFAIFMLNSLNRFTRDITLYADPSQFKSMLRDPVPAWSLVNDLRDCIAHSIKFLGGQPEDMSDKEWENFISKTKKEYVNFLPYGFNIFYKVDTYFGKSIY